MQTQLHISYIHKGISTDRGTNRISDLNLYVIVQDSRSSSMGKSLLLEDKRLYRLHLKNFLFYQVPLFGLWKVQFLCLGVFSVT